MDGTLKTKLMSVMEENGNSSTSITLYLRNIEKIYEKMLPLMKRPSIFKNLNFLRDTELVEKVLTDYAENTKKSYLTSIVVALKANGLDKKPDLVAYNFWYAKMMDKAETLKAVDTTQLTPTQKENWMDWDDIVAIYDNLAKQVRDTNWITTKHTSKTDNLLKEMMVLSLYVNIQPRRNQDYQNMVLSLTPNAFNFLDYAEDPKMPMEEAQKINHLCLVSRTFIFNAFKTSKALGTQKIKIPDTLWNDITTYLAYHNRIDTVSNKITGIPYFLVDSDKQFNTNTITRILNRVLKKNIGCSMLRHIYLSKKYGDTYTEQQADADAMAHSVGTQKSYIKHPTPSETTKHDPLTLQINGTILTLNGNLIE